ncbi:Ig-like domain-containing protein, partial [Provencibacterium massiliense]|uniref:Ig-like domain-containing protein n=1 Tax=Provencibacterium massiliense TaxID=1841868 RepID=UPI00164DC3EE
VAAPGLITAHTGGTATVTASVYGGKVKATCTVNVSAVTGVSLSHTAYTLFTGGTAAETQFTLSATLTGGVSSDELEWTNSDPGAAAMTVAADGRSATIDASGRTAGSTTITAHIKGAPDTAQYKASCTVTVVTIGSVSVSPGNYTIYTLAEPRTVQLAATVTPNAAPVWSSSNLSAATVNETGLVTAVAPGGAIVTASVGGKSASCAVTVKDRIAVTSVTVSGNNNLVRTSDNLSPTSQLSATTDPPNVTFPAVTWAKTGGSASININASGLVTATAAGSATFTATVDGMTSAPYTVTVTDQKVTGITIAQKSVDKGGTVQMSTTVSPANALNRNITWSLDSGNVASISAAGLVTGGVGSNGTVTVKATAADGSGVSETGTVTVNGCEHALSAGGYGSGAGTSGSPWKVGTEAQLRHIDQHNTGKSFLQENDITLAQTGGATSKLSGAVYDGNGYYIKNLSVNETGNGGLFGWLDNSTVQNVGVTTTNWITGYNVGGIAGACDGATIQNCFVEAKIMSCDHVAPAYPSTGGIAGGLMNSTVTNCYFAGTIQNTSLGSGTSPDLRLIGGITPYARGSDNKQCIITNTYNMADLNYGSSIWPSLIGAITGDSSFWVGSNCYSGLVYSANNYWLSTARYAPAYGIGAWYGAFGQATVNPGPSNAGCAALTSFSSLPPGLGSDWEMGTVLFQRSTGSSSRVSAPVLKIFTQKHP